jgi:hypothetical protein
MKRVWFYNWIGKGYLDFWDYFSVIEETQSIQKAYNDIKKEQVIETEEEIIDGLISAYIYWSIDTERHIDIKQIKIAVSGAGGLGVSKDRFIARNCLSTLKSVLNRKDYEKCRIASDKLNFLSTKKCQNRA